MLSQLCFCKIHLAVSEGFSWPWTNHCMVFLCIKLGCICGISMYCVLLFNTFLIYWPVILLVKKYMFCDQVVEILARNLETESSLHRRVDLFFLADSITQCSRGLKGNYPSIVIIHYPPQENWLTGCIICGGFVGVKKHFEFSGDVGGIYPSAIQAVLSRLLSAAAPPGNAAHENRKQCLRASEFLLK